MRLAGMDTAVERLLKAVAAGERIAVHGDYDVDGITATVIVRRTLELLGGDVVHFVPDRMRDGYGLNTPAIERLHAEGARVVVSVDCGIRGAEAARRAQELGVDLIITDHHEPDDELPEALAVINPKRRDCTYPDKNLAGVGVALEARPGAHRAGRARRLAARVRQDRGHRHAGRRRAAGRREPRHRQAWPRGAVDEARTRPACARSSRASGLAGKPIDSYHVSFMLAPRVNAAGRMSSPDIALRLLLAADDGMIAEARELAAQLNTENERRQQEERAILAEARKVVESRPRHRRPRRSSSSPATAGIAASSGSWRRSWSTRSTGRPIVICD